MFFTNDDELRAEARDIAKRTMQSDNMHGYIEGEVFRVLKLEKEVSSLKTNFWLLIFVIFILPIFLRA